ncbi:MULTISPECIES: phosphatase PAP2 family protein [Variovorax]|jgi:membrane-associated phospholipid phosphatase|uniref:phosphatase PAP2 family protein n=1 Tax=Variovorax TaxID=34072 RepID=UPI000C49BB8D|nr:phosphatase PAP2 family protein [Variovorax sp.]MBS74190.1 phosphatase PAP2 family protein [Variovorax sp.]
MTALHSFLFEWIGAGYTPTPWILFFARAIAPGGGAWICILLMGWAWWRQPSERNYVVAVSALCGVAAILSHAIAAKVNLPRPFMAGLSPAYIEHASRGALPSTHAVVMFTAALLFLVRRRLRAVGIALTVIAAVTGWARVYVGVHFPLDIAAGLLLAAVLAVTFLAFWRFGRRCIAKARAHGGTAGT